MTACFSSTSIAFYDIVAQAWVEIKISFETRKRCLHSFQVKPKVAFFKLFFRFSFFPFSFIFAAVIGLACRLQRKRHRDEQILPWRSHV